MRSTSIVLLCSLVAISLLPAPAPAAPEQCTSAAILPAGSVTGGPVLWKNRDTGALSNKVVYIEELPYSYLGLVNANSPAGRAVWAGINTAGFGIINTVAYNLPTSPDEMQDLEGRLMADALRTCGTVADFAAYLDANLGPALGSQANFGVLDGDGGAMFFEVHNHGYEMVDPAIETTGCLVTTNHARTGEEGEGAGYLRFERASELFAALPAGPIDFRTILTTFTRDTGHVLVRQPTPFEMKDVPGDRPLWVNTRDTINKAYTSAAVILVGRNPDRDGSVATMWIIPGEPVTAIAIPMWVEAAASPAPMWEGEEASMWLASARLKRIARPFEEGNKQDYLDLTVLNNAEGTGFLPALLNTEREIIAETDAFLATPHTAEEYRSFQNQMAKKALAALKEAHPSPD